VLAYGPMDNLHHACKAVEEAEWALHQYGDLEIGNKLLAQANETLEAVRKARSDSIKGNSGKGLKVGASV
jgi:hypothetical protein